jgi:hypothetical protein
MTSTDFSRWNPVENSSWSAQVFKRYHEELLRHTLVSISGRKYIYQNLGQSTASWEDKASKHFILPRSASFNVNREMETLKGWSDGYNAFEEWALQHSIMALASNFETYLDSIVTLALRSDPGLLIGVPKAVDGVLSLKQGTLQSIDYQSYIMSITKGTWSSRLSAFERLFGSVPHILATNVKALEKIRKIRNDIGHAFGRDLEMSRGYSTKNLLELNKILPKKVEEYQKLIWDSVSAIDDLLLKEHIGNFQFLWFYHENYDRLNKGNHLNNAAALLKKDIGHSLVASHPKKFYIGLVNYYEAL